MTLFAYGFSPFTLIVILVIILLLFGNRLPSMMRSLGRGVVEFKKGLEGGEEGGDEDEPRQVKKDEAK